MTLQKIMDSTPVEWSRTYIGDYVGSGFSHSYLIGLDGDVYVLRWYMLEWLNKEEFKSFNEDLIIDKINELEGIN